MYDCSSITTQTMLKNFFQMTEEEDKKKVFPFHEMGLDDRILKAIAKLGWVEPTLIQERAVPLIMEGKDLLARS